MTRNNKLNFEGGKQYPPINVNNDRLMVIEGLRPPVLEPIQKTAMSSEERDKLRLAKYNVKFQRGIKQFHSKAKRLIVHVVNPTKQKDFKTTYSLECAKEALVETLKSFEENYGVKIKKFYFNYQPGTVA